MDFDLKGARKWRGDTSVTTRKDIVLLPNTMHVVEGYIEYHELRTLTIEDCKFGGVYPLQEMGDRGIEVKHTLNRLFIQREGEHMVASLNLMLQNRGSLVQIIKQGTQIGGYRSQGKDAEDRTELASIEGLQLAVSLDLEGTDAIRGLLSSTRSGRSQNSIGPPLVVRRGAKSPPTTQDMPPGKEAPDAVQKHTSLESGDSRRGVPWLGNPRYGRRKTLALAETARPRHWDTRHT